MKKYRVTCYPTVENYTVDVEADSIEEAIEAAEVIVNLDTGFIANIKDVEELGKPKN